MFPPAEKRKTHRNICITFNNPPIEAKCCLIPLTVTAVFTCLIFVGEKFATERKKKSSHNCSLSGSLSSFLFFIPCRCLTQFLSSTLSLSSSLALFFSPSSSSSHCLSLIPLSASPAPCLRLFSLSLALWQTEGWWVCCRSNSFIQPPSVGTSSITQWRHTNTTVFPRQNDLVVSVRKQNETRQHEHPSLYPSLHPSFPHPSICPPCMLACMLITHSGREDNRRVKTIESSLTIIALSLSRFSSWCGCLSSQMFVVWGFIEMRWNIIDRCRETKKMAWYTHRR